MRRPLQLLGALMLVGALVLTILIGQTRPFTTYGQGTAPLPTALQSLNATGARLLTAFNGTTATITPLHYVGYNQGYTLRGIRLCPGETGTYAFTGRIDFSRNLSDQQAIQLAERQLQKFLTGDQQPGVIVRGSAKNLSAGARFDITGKTKATILATYNAHHLYLTGSARGCYPLAQLPATTAGSLAGAA